ncbi:hypothetical protein K7432_005056 [Basidiobolus ranarum]|uniref:Zn(2)-C6 fungal-type domain-containing protein n=1 Tax=Basidiobolus ranarum TaxID=34480 RepID=A0ABR2W3Q4_9FUNG
MGIDDSQKRQRVSKACDNCRRRKVRCDGTQPICSNCRTIGTTCSYNDATKKRGPPKGYIEAIENRLHRMEHILGGLVQGEPGAAENVVAELRKLDENHPTATSSTSPARSQTRTKSSDKEYREPKETITDSPLEHNSPSSSVCTSPPQESPLPSLNSPDSSSTPKREDTELEELSNEAEQLTLDDHGRVRYCGTSSGFYLLRQSERYQNGVLKMRSRSPEKLNFSSFGDSEFNPSLLPSSELFSYLLEIYFSKINPIFPLLHKAEFLERLNKVDDEPPFFLLNSILALSSILISSESILKNENLSPEIFYKRASVLLDRTFEMSSMDNIQALILLGIHQHITHSGMRAWIYGGMAIRMAEDLGLHRNPDKWDIKGLTREEKEARKRVWWVCYQIDRHAGVCVGRPLCIDDRHFDTTLPIIDPSTKVESGVEVSPDSGLALKPFIQVIRLNGIIGRIMSEIYPIRTTPTHNPQKNKSILLELDSVLHSWLVSLPEGLQYNPTMYSSNQPPNSPTLIYAHMWYHCALVLLHRPYIPKPGEEYRFPYPSLPICTSAASRITSIALACSSTPALEQTAIFLLFPIFTSSTIHLLNATSTDPWISNPAKKHLAQNIRVLEHIKRKWGCVGKYHMLLLELITARNISLEPENVDNEINPPKVIHEEMTSITSVARLSGLEKMKNEPDSNAVASTTESLHYNPMSEPNLTEINPYIPTQWTTLQTQANSSTFVNNATPLVSENSSVRPNRPDNPRNMEPLNIPIDSSLQSNLPLSVETQESYDIEMAPDPYAMTGAVPSVVFDLDTPSSTLPEISSASQRTLEQYISAGSAPAWDIPMSFDFDEWNEYVGQYMVESSITSGNNSALHLTGPSKATESGQYRGSINDLSQSQTSKLSMLYQYSSVSSSPSISANMNPRIQNNITSGSSNYISTEQSTPRT